MRKIVLIILIVVLSLLSFSCGKEKFGHAEMRIPLNSDFESLEIDGYDVAYSNGEKVVAAMRISFEAGFNQGIPETFTPTEFAAFYLKEVGRNEEVERDGYLAFCDYKVTDGEVDYYYLISFYRTKFAYFVVLFSAPDGDNLRADFLEMANSIYFEYD